ncbi:Uncharacterised protein [Mycobacteroides abscessus subsp. abscessus]|nr:Uncharacterised protein [Mycobacteroides abscessus subsp. abscessus]
MPPLTPPRNLLSTYVVSRSSPVPSSCARRYSAYTLKSDGMESNPQQWTIRAPVSAACFPYTSMLSRTKLTSPVRSA